MSASTAPAPVSLVPAFRFSGDDGSWSTFQIAVGTPPQAFNVLPSTTGSETWIPIPEGCEGVLINIQNCGILRGVQNFDGKASRGFETNLSSTWYLIGPNELSTEQNLWGPDGNPGLYGLDTVTLESTADKEVELPGQIVAGVATANVWLGSLGLGTSEGVFAVHPQPIPSIISTLQSQNYTSSLSFGYAAGASYTSPQDYGSLLLGGYDEARFTPSNLNFSIAGTNRKTLPVSIASVVVQNAFGGTLALLPDGKAITTVIDSTVAQMWLPQNVCDLFAQAFGLTFDPYSELYLVNRTTHDQLKQMNPTVTFTVSSTDNSKSTTNIELPYAAFDLQGTIPLLNSTTNYFPLRVAANESQQVLGRAFLQEAYLFVDWERDYFTIGQVKHKNSTSNVVTVLSPSSESNSKPSSGNSIGTIAGIAVGACIVIVLLVGVAAFLVFRKRSARWRRKQNAINELHNAPLKPSELSSEQVYEMQEGEPSRHELEETKLTSELQGEPLSHELDGYSNKGAQYGWDKQPTTYYEMP